ncbi:MAG: hypothetical protein C1O27_001852 [Chloroflexi bacterium]|nr:MAG: hypothetical protein C1O27_001852 [Chloroflexota bacterium]
MFGDGLAGCAVETIATGCDITLEFMDLAILLVGKKEGPERLRSPGLKKRQGHL